MSQQRATPLEQLPLLLLLLLLQKNNLHRDEHRNPAADADTARISRWSEGRSYSRLHANATILTCSGISWSRLSQTCLYKHVPAHPSLRMSRDVFAQASG